MNAGVDYVSRTRHAIAASIAVAMLAMCGACGDGSATPGATRTPAGRELRTPSPVPDTPTAITATAVVTDKGTRPVPQPPPRARLVGHGETVELVTGSFFWGGVQADAFTYVTSPQSYAVMAGEPLVVANPAPEKSITSGDVASMAMTAEPVLLDDGSGLVEWPFGSPHRTEASSFDDTGIRFAAPAASGKYVVLVFFGFADGTQVYYLAYLTVP